MTATSGGFDANPDELDAAAALLDEAAGEADIAADRIGQGTVPAGAFGRSGQAAELAAKWDAAVRARVTEVQFSANETRRLADELRATSDEYRQLEDGSAKRFGN